MKTNNNNILNEVGLVKPDLGKNIIKLILKAEEQIVQDLEEKGIDKVMADEEHADPQLILELAVYCILVLLGEGSSRLIYNGIKGTKAFIPVTKILAFISKGKIFRIALNSARCIKATTALTMSPAVSIAIQVLLLLGSNSAFYALIKMSKKFSQTAYELVKNNSYKAIRAIIEILINLFIDETYVVNTYNEWRKKSTIDKAAKKLDMGKTNLPIRNIAKNAEGEKTLDTDALKSIVQECTMRVLNEASTPERIIIPLPDLIHPLLTDLKDFLLSKKMLSKNIEEELKYVYMNVSSIKTGIPVPVKNFKAFDFLMKTMPEITERLMAVIKQHKYGKLIIPFIKTTTVTIEIGKKKQRINTIAKRVDHYVNYTIYTNIPGSKPITQTYTYR